MIVVLYTTMYIITASYVCESLHLYITINYVLRWVRMSLKILYFCWGWWFIKGKKILFLVIKIYYMHVYTI